MTASIFTHAASGTQYICDCGEQHLDNPFCFYRNLKYNKIICSDARVAEAAVAEGIMTQEDADSLRVTQTLCRYGETKLHRDLFKTYQERLDAAASRLIDMGYQV